MLKLRLVTAMVLIAVFVSVLFFTPAWTFRLLITAVLVLAAWEWGRLAGLRGRRAQLWYPQSIVLGALICQWLIVQGYFSWAWPFGVALIWWLGAFFLVATFPKSAGVWSQAFLPLLIGLLVLVPTALGLEFLLEQPKGQWLVLLLVGLVACADSGAYFVGRVLGKRKLAPAVSPGKSWEGVCGGLLVVALLALTLVFSVEHLRVVPTLMVLLPAALFSVLGDLVESMIKRQRGVKDSSQLLPGHGGFMDRIDGLTAAAPIFALSVLLTGWSL